MTRAELVDRMAPGIGYTAARQALAAIEAAGVVLLPRVEDWPRAMNVAFCDALDAWNQGDIGIIPNGIMAPALAASPLAKEGGEHG